MKGSDPNPNPNRLKGREIVWKLALTHTRDPNRPTTRDPNPNWPMMWGTDSNPNPNWITGQEIFLQSGTNLYSWP